MLSKKLNLTAAVCSLVFVFVSESRGVADGYNPEELASDLQRDTRLPKTTVTDRSELTSTADRVNADKVAPSHMLHTVVKNMPIDQYNKAISTEARSPAFDAHRVGEGIVPLVSAVVDMKRSLTGLEVKTLEASAAGIFINGNTLTVLNATRETMVQVQKIEPEAIVMKATTACMPKTL